MWRSVLTPPIACVLIVPATADEAKPQNYREGLRLLSELGVPDMKGAKWIRPPAKSNLQGRGFNEVRSYLNVTLKGGVWLIPGEPAKLHQLGDPVPVVWKDAKDAKAEKTEEETPNLLQRMIRKHAEESGNDSAKPASPFHEASLKEDVDALVAAFGNPQVRERLTSSMRYSRVTLPGACLIFAAQLQSAGFQDEADRLTAALFQAFPNGEFLIDFAVDQLAERRYSDATQAFFAKPDWTVYRNELKLLLDKFPRGWSNGPAVARLLTGVEKRAAGAPVPEPSLTNIPLVPEAREALHGLLDPAAVPAPDVKKLLIARGMNPAAVANLSPEQLQQYTTFVTSGDHGGDLTLWTLAAPPETQAGAPPLAPLDRLKALGMDGLIALAAVAEDPTLTASRPIESGMGHYSYSPSSESSSDELYKELFRPASRGEIATQTLAAVVPSEESEEDAVTTRDLAIAFWKEHHAKPKPALAVVYLAKGGTLQRTQAATWLGEAGEVKLLEDTVLAAEQPEDFLGVVSAHVDRKKAAAKPFIDAYAKRLRQAVDGVEESSLPYALREGGGVEGYLKRLSVKAGGGSVDELLKEMVTADDTEAKRLFASLSGLLATQPPELLLESFAKTAASAPLPRKRLLFALLQYSTSRNEEDGGEKTRKEPVLNEGIFAKWKPLIEDTTPISSISGSEDTMSAFTEDCRTLGDQAALAFESVCTPGLAEVLFLHHQVFGGDPPAMSYLRERVKARFEGRELPAYPDGGKVGEERMKAIVASVAAAAPKDIPKLLASLTPDERAAWVAWTDETSNEEFPASLRALRNVVTFLPPSGETDGGNARLADLGITRDFVLNPESVIALTGPLLKQAAAHSRSSIHFETAPLGCGLQVEVAKERQHHMIQYYLRMLGEHVKEPHDTILLFVGGDAVAWILEDGKPREVKIEDDGTPVAETLKQNLTSADTEIDLTFSAFSADDIRKFSEPEPDSE